MPSIKKVAEVAGVSVGTVSHVITGSVRVSDPLRQRVQAAIHALNYHPNHVARSLKTSKTRTLGIMVPDMTIPFFPRVIRGAEVAARERGYSVLAVNSDDDEARQRELLSLFRSQRVEGIMLVIAAAPTPLRQISRILDASIPVVCLDRVPDRVSVDSVSVDDLQAASIGVEHLIAEGNRRIAIVTGPLALKNERRRLLGYKRALRRASIPVDPGLIWQGNLRPDDVAALCRERLMERPLPGAIFSTNGPTALGVLRALRDSGLRTPGDIAFATFDELTVDDLFSPAITSVVQPAYDIGYRAAEILLTRIEGERPNAEQGPITIRLPATLKVGETSRAAMALAGGGSYSPRR
jgi:DNA-binding LacI/PurR family transcriptional regulator